MAFGMTTPVIAVDFGVASMKALQLSADGKQVLGAAMVDTPRDLRLEHSRRAEYQMDALPKLLKGAGIKGKRVVCSIPASQTYVHHFRIPKQDDVPLDTAVGAELLAHTHCDPARVVFRSIPVKGALQSSSKLETICIALARDLVLKKIAAFKKLKMETLGVFSEHLAMHAACLAMTEKTEDASFPTLYLDISATSTKAIITHSGKLVFAKTIGIGGASFDQAVARHRKCGQVAAHVMRVGHIDGHDEDAEAQSVALADPREIESQCAEPVESLTDEISMCLRYHRQLFPDDPVCRAILLGGETRSKPLCHAVARTLRLPTQIADPFARLGKESTFKSFTVTANGVMTRNECVIELTGDDAVAHVAGAAVGDGDFHHDDTVFVTHDAERCESRQVFKKVLRNGATGVFQGKILVKEGAQKTDGYQISQSLLLDDDSTFLAKPELEIYADDVVCSHGSTSGAIDEEALFYLRSRGVPEHEAQSLLVLAFLAEAIEEIEDEAIAEDILGRLQEWLQRHNA